MARLTPEFSAARAIREYTEDHYLPAASGYHERAAADSEVGASLLQWQQNIARHWDTVRFGALGVETHDGRHVFRVEVFPGDLKPDQFKVELYAEPLGDGRPDLGAMKACEACPAPADALSYSAEIGAARSANDYTLRVVPHHENASVPLEASQILWQR